MLAAGDTHGGAATGAGMETLALDEDRPSFLLASANYRSAMSSLSDANHPLAAAAAANPPDDDDEGDPLGPASPPFAADAESISDSLLDPPSYADVVFTPFPESNGDAANGRSGGAPVSPKSPSASSERYIRISVADPQKEAEVASSSLVPGGNTFVTYLVTTRTNEPDLGGGGPGVSDFAVRRRFRDVVVLADRLAETYRGFFVPPRPDKSVVESQVMQKQEFVEQRRAALERYLARLAEHPVIGGSDELKAFLTSSGKLPSPASTTRTVTTDWSVKVGGESTVFGGNEVVQPAKGGRDLLRMFKELKQSVANDWGGAKPAVVEEDKEFLEKKERMQDLEQQLTNASQQASSLIVRLLVLLDLVWLSFDFAPIYCYFMSLTLSFIVSCFNLENSSGNLFLPVVLLLLLCH